MIKKRMEQINTLKKRLDEALAKENQAPQAANLMTPIQYILSIGGKRIRPILCLLACQIYKEEIEAALKPALAIEIFHNFTLMHDDVMDKAPLRRGKQTVHKKFGLEAAILSGDYMLIQSYQYLRTAPEAVLLPIWDVFNQTAAEVCYGQQLDMDFEQRLDVKATEYIQMITWKTAVLLAASLKIGALIGGAENDSANALYQYGKHIGIAFQLQDDLLDTYGEQAKFGKQTGGDIIQNKKTYLLIKALESPTHKKDLVSWIEKENFDSAEKVEAVTNIYNQIGIKEMTRQLMEEHYQLALSFMDQVKGEAERKQVLVNLGENLMHREI